MLERGTVLQQQREYAELVPHWSGELEARGEARGLSSYQGKSSIYHSVNWERSDQLERREDNRARRAEGFAPIRGSDGRPRVLRGSKDAEVLERLKKGCSYGAICRELGVTLSVPRRVARINGIDRSVFRSGVRA
jgi:hypothetical protein